MKNLNSLLATLILMGLLIACSASGNVGGAPNLPSPGGGGELGATPGGVQDMGLARELVKNGTVPPKEAFTVEGMFSEYDLPLEGKACEELLCLRGALGVAPTLNEESSAWVQVGLSSSLDIERFERPSLSLVLVIDVSGSMGWEYQTVYEEYQTPLKVAQSLLNKLIPELNVQDEVAIVTYGSSARTSLEFTSGHKHEDARGVIDGLRAGGSTAMEAGLRLAYELMSEANNRTAEKRLLLFTDVQPNVGATTATEFERLVQNGANEGTSITVFGVGIGLGPDIFETMSKVRGGNAFSLFGSEEINKIVKEDWPFLVSPVAYDLSLRLLPSNGFRVAEGYGFPTTNNKAELNVSTVFFSRRRGALLVRLSKQDSDFENLSVQGLLSYETLDRKLKSQTLDLKYNGQPLKDGHYYEQPSVGKTVALGLLVSNMRKAVEMYGTRREEAVSLMQDTLKRFRTDTENYPELSQEVSFAQALYELMRSGAKQGTLYGQ